MVPIQSITADMLTSIYGKLEREGGKNGRPLAKKTVRYTHTVIGKALKDAARWRLIRSNPAPLADPPTAKQTAMKTPKAWNAEQLGLFFSVIGDDRLRPMWWFLATTGVRRGEAAGLRWSNVNLDEGWVAIVETRSSVNYKIVEGEPKTAKGKRRIALDPVTVKVLREWKARQTRERLAYGAGWTDTGHVFTREDGQPWHPDRIRSMFGWAVKRAGLPRITPHGLRHSAASVALANGVPLKVISDRLGHSSISITADVYSHVEEGLDREAAAQIANAIGGGM
jgi:integrase